jgi:hypothetical protein
VLFHRALDPHQMSFAFTEALAHINRLVRRNELRRTVENGRIFYVPQTAGAVRQL